MTETCFYCGRPVGTDDSGHIPDHCPHCGAPVRMALRFAALADRSYNRALAAFRVHDLTSAENDLRRSLALNKFGKDARNLLGLCLYFRGEYVGALSEWIISQNFYPKENRAAHYLNELRGPGKIEGLDMQITKYNQALQYLKTGSRDLAKIQLKRITGQGTGILEAYQLLALVDLENGDYEGAEKILNEALKIDVGNTRTLTYLDETKKLRHEDTRSKKKKTKVVSFRDGNDSVTMPMSGFRELMDSSRATIINILIGLLIGLLACVFLIIPTVRQNAQNEAANTLVDANEKATASENNITKLKDQVSSLQQELDQYTGKADVVTSYEKLLNAENAVNQGDMDRAASELSAINPELLETNAKARYDGLYQAVNQKKLETEYNEGVSAYNSRRFEDAVTKLSSVVGSDEKFEEGQALYILGQAQARLGRTEEAQKTYQRIQDLFPDTPIERRAERQAGKLEGTGTGGQDGADQPETSQMGTGQPEAGQ